MHRMSEFCLECLKQAVSGSRHFANLHFYLRHIQAACLAMALALIPAGITAVSAHPHIFVNAKLDIVVDRHNQVQKLIQVWYFDPLFSASVVLDFDKNGDRKLDKEELQSLAHVIKQSLAEFNFFQSVNADGKEVVLNPPDTLTADMTDGQLVLRLENTPRTSLVLQQGSTYQFSLYDPSFYVSVSFQKDIDIAVNGLPAFCGSSIERPDMNKILSQSRASYTEDFFADPSTSLDLALQLAPKLNVSCKK